MFGRPISIATKCSDIILKVNIHMWPSNYDCATKGLPTFFQLGINRTSVRYLYFSSFFKDTLLLVKKMFYKAFFAFVVSVYCRYMTSSKDFCFYRLIEFCTIW